MKELAFGDAEECGFNVEDGLEQIVEETNYGNGLSDIGQYKMQTADCRPGTKCRLSLKCRLTRKTAFLRQKRDNIRFHKLPIVTQ